MASTDDLIVTKVESWPIDIPITDPFVVATGRMDRAQNVIVRITLRDGSSGYGEIAPFHDVTGEDRSNSLTATKEMATAMLGKSAAHHRQIASALQELAPSHPAARCGLETALFDAFCRAARMPLWSFWGGVDVRERETDITIPITDLDRTVTLAREWYAQGFRIFKMKVGIDLDEDIRRLEAIYTVFPDVAFVVDANEGFRREDAAEFIEGVTRGGGRVLLFEQPTSREDLDSLAWVRRSTGVPVVADESVCSLKDAKAVIAAHAADFINIKITKSGLLESREIVGLVRAAGLRLMIGGMVETRVAMGCSFSLVLGLGGFDVLDLDTPLLLTNDPVKGGYCYAGPTLHPWRGSGLDMEVDNTSSPVTTVSL